jgi:hypothetical protein
MIVSPGQLLLPRSSSSGRDAPPGGATTARRGYFINTSAGVFEGFVAE